MDMRLFKKKKAETEIDIAAKKTIERLQQETAKQKETEKIAVSSENESERLLKQAKRQEIEITAVPSNENETEKLLKKTKLLLKITQRVMNPKIKKAVEIAIVALVIIVLGLLGTETLGLLGTETLSITTYLGSSNGVTYTLGGFSSRLNVVLTSTGGYIRVKVTVDDQTVYENSNISNVNFSYNMGFGSHTAKISIENPTTFNSTIQISGKVSRSLW